jgi:hypothetical protein
MAIYPSLAVLPWARWTLIAAVIACLVESRSSLSQVRIWALIATFTGVIVASSAGALYPDYSLKQISLWGSWLLAMYVVSSAFDTLEKLILALSAFVLYNFKMSLSAVKSWAAIGFSFRDWGVTGAPGWFGNSGEFGIEMCVFFPIVLYLTFGLWPQLTKLKRLVMLLIAGSAVVGMVASSSRGAVLGGAVIGLWILARSPQRGKAALIVVGLALLTWFLLPPENLARWQAAGEDDTSIKRLTYWAHGLEIANQFPLLGIGFNNWMPYYVTHYNPKGQLPHNIFIECVAQLGYTGLIVYVAIILVSFVATYRVRKITGEHGRHPNRVLYFLAFGFDGALVGFLASGFFVTVLFYPYLWINLAFVMALSRIAESPGASAGVRRRLRRVARGIAPAAPREMAPAMNTTAGLAEG